MVSTPERLVFRMDEYDFELNLHTGSKWHRFWARVEDIWMDIYLSWLEEDRSVQYFKWIIKPIEAIMIKWLRVVFTVLAVLAFWAVCLTVSFFLLTGVILAIDWMFGWY